MYAVQAVGAIAMVEWDRHAGQSHPAVLELTAYEEQLEELIERIPLHPEADIGCSYRLGSKGEGAIDDFKVAFWSSVGSGWIPGALAGCELNVRVSGPCSIMGCEVGLAELDEEIPWSDPDYDSIGPGIYTAATYTAPMPTVLDGPLLLTVNASRLQLEQAGVQRNLGGGATRNYTYGERIVSGPTNVSVPVFDSSIFEAHLTLWRKKMAATTSIFHQSLLWLAACSAIGLLLAFLAARLDPEEDVFIAWGLSAFLALLVFVAWHHLRGAA